MDIAELARRITVLEDIEAIKKLKARYCAVCDNDHNPDDIVKLFAEDGIWRALISARTRGMRRFANCSRASAIASASRNTT